MNMPSFKWSKKNKKAIFIFFTLFFSVFSKEVFAANDEGFSVSPFYSNITIDQNDSKKEIELLFTNQTAYDVVFKFSVIDFGTLDETGGIAFLGSKDISENKYGLASWVVLQKDAIVLGKGESQTVRVIVQNKESLSPGGHYAAVVAKMDEDSFSKIQKNSSDVTFSPSFTSLIFVKKLGGEIYDLDLKEYSFTRDFFGLPTMTRLRFQNKGNVHVVPRGIVGVFDPFGREIQKGIVNIESGIVLPETFRVIPVSFTPVNRAFFPGNYTVFIQYRLDGSENFFVRKESLFCIPLIFVEAICGIMILVGVFWRRKQKNKKKTNGTRKKE